MRADAPAGTLLGLTADKLIVILAVLSSLVLLLLIVCVLLACCLAVTRRDYHVERAAAAASAHHPSPSDYNQYHVQQAANQYATWGTLEGGGGVATVGGRGGLTLKQVMDMHGGGASERGGSVDNRVT